NCRNMMPVVPGKNATGTNTETSTSEVATTAPATSLMATEAAWCGSVTPSDMCRCTFSITTMASSTTNPVARVMPNSVSVLIENPSALTKMKVPTRETGIVTAGITVERQSCRNRKMTKMTSRMASTSVLITSLIESATTSVVSKATLNFRPGGKLFDSLSSSPIAARSTAIAFAFESCVTPTPTA